MPKGQVYHDVSSFVQVRVGDSKGTVVLRLGCDCFANSSLVNLCVLASEFKCSGQSSEIVVACAMCGDQSLQLQPHATPRLFERMR